MHRYRGGAIDQLSGRDHARLSVMGHTELLPELAMRAINYCQDVHLVFFLSSSSFSLVHTDVKSDGFYK